MLDDCLTVCTTPATPGTRSVSPHPSSASGCNRIRTPQICSCNGQLFPCRRGNYPLALSLFDKLVALEPDWAEAWNQRATTRFLTGDTDGAMADIDQVMKLEPRHFGALAGMGMILQGEGLDKSALEIFKKALGIYPLAAGYSKTHRKAHARSRRPGYLELGPRSGLFVFRIIFITKHAPSCADHAVRA